MSAFYFTDSALCSQTDLILKAQLVICSHTHTYEAKLMCEFPRKV